MKFKEYDQEQSWLIPPNIEDEIPSTDICRVINDVIEVLDISAIENTYKEEGNPAYHPRMMIKILFYSYAKKVFSSRRIAEELERNIFYWYLSGKQRPDFRTIALFRVKHIEHLRSLFIQIVKLCIALGLADLSLVSIDGTKIKANADREKFRDKKWLETKISMESKKINDAFREAERIDSEEDIKYGRARRGDEIPEELADRKIRLEKIKKLKGELEKRDAKQINETDPDAKIMKTKGRYIPAYNCQAVVDDENQIIVMADVTDAENDWHQVKVQINRIKDEYAMKPEILLGDTGYCGGESLKYLHNEGIEGIIADKSLKEINAELKNNIPVNKQYKKDQFHYDVEYDVYWCPEGNELKKTTKQPLTAKRKGGEDIEYYQYKSFSCKTCNKAINCCNGKNNRTITRYADEVYRERMADKIRSERGYSLYKRRMQIIEPVFANIKNNYGFNSFSLRGIAKTRGEFFIISAIHNIQKIKNHILGIGVEDFKTLLFET